VGFVREAGPRQWNRTRRLRRFGDARKDAESGEQDNEPKSQHVSSRRGVSPLLQIVSSPVRLRKR
jgi:hypothetical protein